MFLYGASGHAKVIIELLEENGIKPEGLFDDNESIQFLFQYPVKKFNVDYDQNIQVIISIGNNKIREKIAKSIAFDYQSAIHPKSIISKRSTIGAGSVIMGGVTINADTNIGQHCIVNTNASIDHECTIEDFVHISPNATLCGNVEIGKGTHVGAGAVVIPDKKIGKWCVIGAGAVVINDIPDFCTAVGNPCIIIKNVNKSLNK